MQGYLLHSQNLLRTAIYTSSFISCKILVRTVCKHSKKIINKLIKNQKIYISSFPLDVWQFRDEINNFEQKHDAELIKEAKR